MKIAVNDTTLFVDVEGSLVVASESGWVERPTVLMLHPGPGADHSLYKHLIGPRLAEVAQVVYVDNRGEGRSDPSEPSRWNLDTWADDALALLDVLEIERPVVYGASIGSLIAVELAARAPGRLAGLVLVSAAARYLHARSVAVFDRLGGAEAGEIAARYFGDPTEANFAEYLRVCLPLYTRKGIDPDVVARMQFNQSAAVLWDREHASHVDVRASAARVDCPALVVSGADDPSFTVAGGRELAESLPAETTRFVCVDGAGYGVWRDRPDQIEGLLEFVAGLRPGAG
jgi:pimeloyl-ACP methyl ester carboxylesterase